MTLSLDEIHKELRKLWSTKALDFVVRKRFCLKHMREWIKNNIVEIENEDKLNVVSLFGICSKCKKATLVFYIEGEIKRKKKNV